MSAVTPLNCCSCGESRIVQFHCHDEDVLFCKPCKHDHHRNCNVTNILHSAKGILENEEFREITKELEVLRNVFMKLKENRNLKSMQKRQRRNAILSLSNLRTGRRDGIKNNNSPQSHLGASSKARGSNGREIFQKNQQVVAYIDYYLKALTESILAQNEMGALIAFHRAKHATAEFRKLLNLANASSTEENYFSELQSAVVLNMNIENKGSVKLSRVHALNKPVNNSLVFRQSSENIRKSTSSRLSRGDESSRKRHAREPRLSASKMRFRPAFRPQAIRMATVLSSLKSRSMTFVKTPSLLRRQTAHAPPEEVFINSRYSEHAQSENHVTAMAILRDGRFVVLDCRSNRIKLFSIDNRYLLELLLHSSVWDCEVVGNLILVTCPAEGKIQRIQVTSNNRMFESGAILTQKDCKAICFYNHRLYVTYTGLCPCVKILSKDGIVYRSIDARHGKAKIFQNPLYMHVSRNGKIIYLSDFTLQRLTVLDHKGNVRRVLDVSPNWPLGITVDKDDNVILAVTGDNDVRLVTGEGSRMKTLIAAKSLESEPSGVMCKHGFEGQKLYVAFAGKPTIKVYTLMY